jgi:glutaminyl-tRNA synthetase
MYDWAHGESDYIEQISHSLCSLEFKPHRELYDWFKKHVFKYSNLKYQLKPKQREFARLNLSYTIMSKRKLLTLVEKGFVNGWDDPRMPTISGLRRRGYTPSAINKFINTIGVAKRDNIIDVSLLEFCVREDLNKAANRVMAVTDPVKLIISNYKDDKTEWLEAENNPENPKAGKRKTPFSKVLYIEREDFKEEATGKYFRLAINKEVRLKNAYIIKAESCNKNSNGDISEVLCTYDPLSLSGSGTEESMRKVKGTLHWVSANHAKEVEVREYDRLFSHPSPDTQNESFISFLNPKSLKIKTAHIEPSVYESNDSIHYQFQRLGYYCVDPESTTSKIIFNKTVGLRDGWAKTKQLPPLNVSQFKPKKAIELIKKLGKKFTNLPLEKQQKTKEEIQSLAHEVEYQELSALFNTALKKTGTRIAVLIALKELLKKGEHNTEEAKAFIKKASEDKNELLKSEAQDLV